MSHIYSTLDQLSTDLPYKELVAFHPTEFKSYKWSATDIKKHTNALAAGLIEDQLCPGMTIASWQPKNTPEDLIVKMVAARIGCLHVSIDMDVQDPAQLREIFNETKTRVLVYDIEAGDRYNTKLLWEVMPELRLYDGTFAHIFRSRKVPTMRQLIHIGIEYQLEAHNLKYMLAYHPMPTIYPPLPSPEWPLAVSYGVNGKKGPILSHKDALTKSPDWEMVAKILNKEHTIYGAPTPLQSVK
jgi:hypothetical protein